MRHQVAVTAAFLSLFALSAIGAPTADLVTGITPCHDMAHLLDAGFAAAKAEREHPQDGPKSFCQTPPGTSGVQVCLKAVFDSEDTNYIVSYEVDGKVMQRWTENGPQLTDPFTGFTVESADLGGDGQIDTVIGILESASNGIDVEAWSLYIVPPGGKTAVGPISVNNYMTLSGLYQVPGRQGCVLLSSMWEEDSEPGRGTGTYIKGRWYSLYGDKLGSVSNLPPMEHRLLDSFVKAWSKAGQPFAWFKEPGTRYLEP